MSLRHYANGAAGKIMTAIRELVFGLEDGLVSTLGAVAGIAAGTQDGRIVALSGLVLIAVEALSMAAGSYLSNKSHREMLEKKIRDERHEIETKPEEETDELREMYRERGFTTEETEMIVRRVTSDKKLWLEEMMAKELKIGAGELETPSVGALVMGVSYVVGGFVPVLPFLLLPVGPAQGWSVAASLLALFALGWWKGTAAGIDRLKSAAEMLLVASAAAGLGYGIGKIAGLAFGLTS